jgi:hypothetical protein
MYVVIVRYNRSKTERQKAINNPNPQSSCFPSKTQVDRCFQAKPKFLLSTMFPADLKTFKRIPVTQALETLAFA